MLIRHQKEIFEINFIMSSKILYFCILFSLPISPIKIVENLLARRNKCIYQIFGWVDYKEIISSNFQFYFIQ